MVEGSWLVVRKGERWTLAAISSEFHLPDGLTAEATAAEGIQVPYSAGRRRPVIRIPVNACDCHHHIYDPVRFPYLPTDVRNQPPATVDAYRLLQKRLGLTRNVIVTPSAYGTDNCCTLDALRQMGSHARGVVVINTSISDADLQQMHSLGVRGVRFNIATGGSNDCDMIVSLSERINELGWHVQFWMSANDTVKMEDFLLSLASPIVFDHRGHLPPPDGVDHPAFRVICNLIDKGKTWVKLSGLYLDTKAGDPTYTDTVKVGQAYVTYAAERMVWGTDWPHPTIFSERRPWPDDAAMLDQLADQAPDEFVRNRILVDNPAVLYGFNK